jgi:uncharacterized protein YceK
MKKILLVVGLITAMAGCGTLGSKNSGSEAEMAFNMPNGSLTLKVDANGEFVSAKTIATAEVLSNTSAGKEAAITVATGRAKRTLAAFMSNDIKATDTVNQIANATNTDDTYAQEVVEKINVNAQALLRGAYVSKQTLEGDTVFVEVTVTSASIKGSRSLHRQMSGA